MEFDDYSTHLMDLEKILKNLHQKCLHKNYEGYINDIGQAHEKLSRLLIWIAKQEVK